MKKIYLFTLAIVFSFFANAQCPTFSITAPMGTVVGCSPTTVQLDAINTSTLSGVTYTWMSSTGTQFGSSIMATSPGASNTFTVIASAPSSTCTSTQMITITSSTTAPSVTVSPLTQTLGCNSSKTFTAITSSTTNLFGTWYDNNNTPLTLTAGSPLELNAGSPGIYSVTFTNVINGCTTTQTVSVTSTSMVPTMTINSVIGGFVINCVKPCLPLSITSNFIIGPVSYTWTNLTTSVSTFPATGGYTVCQTGANVPGLYVASVMDGFGCRITKTISITIDTLRPAPSSIASLSGNNSYTLNCFNSCVTVTATTNPMYPASNYSWTVPPNLIQSSNTATVCLVNVSSSVTSTNYTVLARSPANGCVGSQLVRFYKNTFVPPYTAVFTPSAITCANPCVAFSPYSSSSSTVPITFTFTSPPPTQTATTVGALFCVPGTYTMTYMNQLNGCSASTSTSVPVNSPCGVNEISLKREVLIAPNPNNGKFIISVNDKIENAEMRITNALGQEIFKQSIEEGSNEINTGSLSKGIYYYKIDQNKELVKRGKILIE